VNKNVLVRMYNVGFGDCFLVEFPNENGGVSRLLIDCGSIAAGPLSIASVAEKVISDCTGTDGVARIDVIVCTHRHADHVSGFANPAWKNVEVEEVWFPWTEDQTDETAKEIRETQSRLALALHSRWSQGTEIEQTMNAGWLSVAINALSNDKAMTMLHEGFRSKPTRKFLSSDGNPQNIKTRALPGVSAYVLGPSKSKDIIRDMNPPAGKTYLRQGGSALKDEAQLEPFASDWPISASTFQARSEWAHLSVSPAEMESINKAASNWDPAITVTLESAVNGTSLVLAFEIGDAVLFFPGDAQWGTWQEILSKKRSADLLKRVSYWKVGHHGSHNATPADFVDQWVPPSCCAMMSTKTGKWASIPRQPLIKAIEKKEVQLARSDEKKNSKYKRFTVWNESIVETKIPITSV
jgi:beta-lactamase superfamily II metal-dependent hydrolase